MANPAQDHAVSAQALQGLPDVAALILFPAIMMPFYVRIVPSGSEFHRFPGACIGGGSHHRSPISPPYPLITHSFI